MDKPRVAVTTSEFEAALLVWLRTMPEGVWRKNEEEERKKAEKRWVAGEFPDPKVDLARYIAGKYDQAGWETTRDKNGNLFG